MSIPISALIDEPLQGAWVASVTMVEEITGSFELGETTWVGTAASPGPILDGARWRATIVGGAGKLGSQVLEKNYSGGIAFATVAADILRDCGESPGTLQVPGQARYYERARQTAGQALTELAAAAGAVWWVGRDGLVSMAPARSSAVLNEADLHRVAFDADGTIVLNALKSSDVLPGMTIDAKKIAALRWSLSPQRLTVDCAFSQIVLPDAQDRFYERTYSAKVHQQNGDGTVDVIANGLFELNRIPLLSGVPGSRITMKPGELVAVGFFGGNRSQPYAVAALQSDSGGSAAALNGDTVTMLLPPFAFVGSAVIGGVPSPVTGVMTALVGQTLGTVTGPSSTRLKLE